MTRWGTARSTRRTSGVLVAALLVVAAAVAVVLGHQLMPSASSAAAWPATTPLPAFLDTDHGAGLDEDDGLVPGGTTVFDDHLPAVTNLDPALLGALRLAATDAGMDVHLNSGWRSAEYQEQLLRQAVVEYGSAEEAARWVATARTSAHVSGDAVDIGPTDAMSWLSRHGSGYGLCQIYGNEPWHYELRHGAVENGCPRAYADPTEDPRMQSG